MVGAWDPDTDTVLVERDVRFDETILYHSANQVATEATYKFLADVGSEDDDTPTIVPPVKTLNEISSDINDDEPSAEKVELPQHHQYNLRDRAEPQEIDNDHTSDDSIYDDPLDTDFAAPSGSESEFSFVALKSVTIPIPKSFEEAMRSEHREDWMAAMVEEYMSLISNNTWKLCPREANMNVIKCKWVYDLKLNTDGTINRFKARLVACGYSQKFGSDYTDTYAPVVRMDTLRIVVARGVRNRWIIKQIDIKTAYLNGKLRETIYMSQPLGFEIDVEVMVCLLLRCLYGLKQSGREWNNEFNDTVVDDGFERLLEDPCAYIKTRGEDTTILLVFVDDIIVVASSKELHEHVMRLLNTKFIAKDLGDLNYCLGVQFVRDTNKGTMHMNQKLYVETILHEYVMSDSKTVCTPMESNLKLPTLKDPESNDLASRYRTLVGKLNYLMIMTRPDLAYVVGQLCRHLQNPGDAHWRLAKRVLRYLNGTRTLGLCYDQNSMDELVGYTDSSYQDSTTDNKSTGGYIFTYAGAPVAWMSRKQRVVANSTMEAEFIAFWEASRQAVWSRSLSFSLNFMETGSIPIFCDSQSGISFARDVGITFTTKHILTKFHYARLCVRDGYISINYISSKENRADYLTKALPRDSFTYLVELSGVEQLTIQGIAN